MMQGDEYSLEVAIKQNGEAIDAKDVAKIEIMFGRLRKEYPGEITFSSELGVFLFPLTQAETFGMPSVIAPQVRVKFLNGEVIGTECEKINIHDAWSREAL